MTENGNGNRDRFFIKILTILSVLVVCFGAAAIVLGITTEPSDPVILRIIGGFGAMFSGMVGLAIGYLSGRGR